MDTRGNASPRLAGFLPVSLGETRGTRNRLTVSSSGITLSGSFRHLFPDMRCDLYLSRDNKLALVNSAKGEVRLTFVTKSGTTMRCCAQGLRDYLRERVSIPEGRFSLGCEISEGAVIVNLLSAERT